MTSTAQHSTAQGPQRTESSHVAQQTSKTLTRVIEKVHIDVPSSELEFSRRE